MVSHIFKVCNSSGIAYYNFRSNFLLFSKSNAIHDRDLTAYSMIKET